MTCMLLRSAIYNYIWCKSTKIIPNSRENFQKSAFQALQTHSLPKKEAALQQPPSSRSALPLIRASASLKKPKHQNQNHHRTHQCRTDAEPSVSAVLARALPRREPMEQREERPSWLGLSRVAREEGDSQRGKPKVNLSPPHGLLMVIPTGLVITDNRLGPILIPTLMPWMQPTEQRAQSDARISSAESRRRSTAVKESMPTHCIHPKRCQPDAHIRLDYLSFPRDARCLRPRPRCLSADRLSRPHPHSSVIASHPPV